MQIKSIVRLSILTPLLAGLVLSFQNCSPVAFRDLGSATLSSNEPSLCVSNPSAPECLGVDPTCSFNGQTLTEGAVVTAFQNSTVAFGSTCVSETRLCTQGQLSGSYNFQSCSPGIPADCLFNGQTVSHDEEVTAYPTSTVPFGSLCEAVTRTCSNGTLSGSASFASCTPAGPASCLFDGKTIPHNGTVKGYQNSSVAFGGNCISEDRVCTNGSLSGSYAYGSCNVGTPNSCLFDGQTIAHGQSTAAYQTSAVAYGQTCTSQSRTCNNGTLSGTYTFGSCTVGTPNSCLFNGQTIAHGQSAIAYQTSGVVYGQTCASQNRTCNNGTLSGSYTFGSCTVGSPKSCLLNGQTIAHGQSVMTYQSSSVGPGQVCASQNRLCTNGSLSGTYTALSCTVNACVAQQGQACEVDTQYYWESSRFANLDACEAYKGNAGFQSPCPQPSAGFQWSGKLCRSDSAPTNGQWRARLLCAQSTMGTISCSGQCQ